MNRADYRAIVRHYEDCLERHGDTHLGVDWPNAADAAVRHRVMLDLVREVESDTPATLLDFGCGAAHLVEFIRSNETPLIAYSGLDLSERFVELSKQKFPELVFHHLDVLEQPQALPTFDYVVMNGVFTEKLGLDHDQMFNYFCNLIGTVFERTHIGLAFNVMSAHVDWQRDDLFHVDFDRLADFLTRELSRHFVFRSDYDLYEYTTYVYRTPSERGSRDQ